MMIGALDETLQNEASEMRILMRMQVCTWGVLLAAAVQHLWKSIVLVFGQETKGALPFHEDLLPIYATHHGGLNECAKSLEQQVAEAAAIEQTGGPVLAPSLARTLAPSIDRFWPWCLS